MPRFDNWYDYINPLEYGAYGMEKGGLRGHKTPTLVKDNPYGPQWDGLISQLQQQANGQGPSLAGEAYKQAQQTGMRNIQSMSRGGSAGAARAGMQNLGHMNQGLAQGYSNARLQEQLAARQMLQGALTSAQDDSFRRSKANVDILNNSKSKFESVMGFLGNMTKMLAMGA